VFHRVHRDWIGPELCVALGQDCMLRTGRNHRRIREIGAAEHDSGSARRRAERQLTRCAEV
jgi:hypothetical protein